MRSDLRSQPSRAGERGVRMACRCKGGQTTIVRASYADQWRCEKCRAPGRPTGHTVVLAEGGALPPPSAWREPPLCRVHLVARCIACEAAAEAV